MNVYQFELDEEQVKELSKWQEAIKTLYGECGQFEFRFSPTGVGCHVSVYSYLAKKEIDLSHVEKW